MLINKAIIYIKQGWYWLAKNALEQILEEESEDI